MSDFDTYTEGNATGKYFYMDLGVELSGASGIEIDFTMPDGTLLTKSGGDISVPNEPLTDPDDESVILAQADQYLAYQWIVTDIPDGSAGQWKAYPRMTINGQPQNGDASACFLVLSKNACC